MSWQAVEMLDTSVDATKRLLLPFDLLRWLVLAIVVFFIGSSGGINANLGNTGLIPIQGLDVIRNEPADLLEIEGAQMLLLGVIIAALFLIIGLLILLIRAFMEFVFVEIVRSESVQIRGFFTDHVRNGIHLLAFWILLGFVVLASAVLFLTFTILTAGIFLLIVALLSPLIFIVGMGLWIVLRFTIDFIVPIMIAEERGIINAWRAFWPHLFEEWKQYGAYAGIRFIIGIAAAIIVGIGFTIVALALAIPFGIVGFGGVFVLLSIFNFQTSAILFGGLTFITFVACVVIVGTTFVQVPVQTYLRYYSLLVLGAITPEFDLVDEIRVTLEEGSDVKKNHDEYGDMM